jgi:hypothetical protein
MGGDATCISGGRVIVTTCDLAEPSDCQSRVDDVNAFQVSIAEADLIVATPACTLKVAGDYRVDALVNDAPLTDTKYTWPPMRMIRPAQTPHNGS